MADTKAIQDLAYQHPDTGFPDRVKERIDSAISSALTKVWRGFLQVAVSGFGKGVLITAAAVLAISMMSGGAAAFIGYIPAALGSAATVDTGVKMGLAAGFHFLTSVGGLITLLAGGALGSVADTQKYQDRINADMAKAEAARFEQARSQTVAKSVTLQKLGEQSPKKPTNGRAANSVADAFAKGELPVKFNGHAEREEERRAAREIVGRAF